MVTITINTNAQKAIKSRLLGDIRSEEAIYSTRNRISLLKVFLFLDDD